MAPPHWGKGPLGKKKKKKKKMGGNFPEGKKKKKKHKKNFLKKPKAQKKWAKSGKKIWGPYPAKRTMNRVDGQETFSVVFWLTLQFGTAFSAPI